MSKICFECGKTAKHEHHVIPKSLGGNKTVPLCEDCHSKVHETDLRLVNLQREAVKRTIAEYKLLGKQWGGGGWNKTNPEIYEEIKSLRKEGYKLKDIASKYKISIPTIWKILNNRLKKEQPSNITQSED
jgi:DNA-binding NarL/FixJ family response regulator